MIIEKNVLPYLVYSEDLISVALQKISNNRQRIIFCVDEHGRLLGSLTDGDFRRWVLANPTAGLQVSCAEVCNQNALSLPDSSKLAEIAPYFSESITHIPLVDARGHLVAVATNRPDGFRIGGHEIGVGQPAYVIAEIGNNHNGSIELAKELVDLASAAGADAVKFQLRDMQSLYRQGSTSTAGEDLGAQYTLDLLRKFSLPAEALYEVFDHARSKGIEIMCTPWDIPSVKALVDYGIAGLKIASADLTNHELIRYAGTQGLPLILSTGMSQESEIIETANLLRELNTSYVLLHCQSTYPAPFKDINLSYMQRLSEIGQSFVGYSGHERGWHVPVAAVAMGARVIEKHFTVDRTMEGNDHTVSLLPDEFAQMVQQIREVEASLGSASPRVVSTGEMMNRVNLAKSLVASRDLAVGQVITEADVAIKSPGRGLQPNQLNNLVGLTIQRPMASGDFFFEGDLKGEVPKGRQYEFNRPWGLPVRYHDFAGLISECKPDFLEFHFSYRDLEIDIDTVFSEPLDMGFTTHLPDLFAGDFLVDLASQDDAIWNRSIQEVQRTIDVTRQLKKWFTSTEDPIMVVTMGGFTKDKPVQPSERPAMYARIHQALQKLDTEGVRIAAQTLPPYPWLMGGQQFHNLFLDPVDTAEFAAQTSTKLCLDISHTKLATNHLGVSFSEAIDLIGPHTIHLHLVDATGVDGEGVQVGDGEVDWAHLASQLDQYTPGVSFIPEIWQGHVNNGQGFWTALDRLEKWF
jgi:sialic acid synthase SpsE/sugar phosphate isomerase/epimerase